MSTEPEKKTTKMKNTDRKNAVQELKIAAHVASVDDEERQDIAESRWDEVLTDSLYHACKADTVEKMDDARRIASRIAKETI